VRAFFNNCLGSYSARVILVPRPVRSAGTVIAAVLVFVAIATTSVAFRQRADRRARDDHARAADSALVALAAEAQRQMDQLTDTERTSLEASDTRAPVRDDDRIRFTLEARLEGTYLAELFVRRDGWNYRWQSRPGDPMRIWVQSSVLPGFNRDYIGLVHDAFAAWSDAGVPMLFTFIPDSTRAEIRVTWVDRFAERVTGRTHWSHDQHGWIMSGTIELALHQFDGRPLGSDAVRAIARHEVGHLLGLDHVRDTTHVMAPQVWVTELSEADRRTVRLVYELPPGRIAP
jgi:hypothetical protein